MSKTERVAQVLAACERDLIVARQRLVGLRDGQHSEAYKVSGAMSALYEAHRLAMSRLAGLVCELGGE